MRFEAHEYQERAIRWVEDHPRCLLFLDMGLGKTVSVLTAVQHLINHGEVERMLVIAPKKVAESTWSTEAEKWDHLDLKVSPVMGDVRRRRAALAEAADVHVISRGSVVWLLDEMKGRLSYDMVVIDELTSFKNHRSLRFKALRKALPSVARVVGLTGTPTPNGLKDLWAQVYCIDAGARLGRFSTHYIERWFNTVVRNNIVIKCWPKPGAEEEIRDLLADIALTMRAEDWLRLPPLLERDVPVSLPEDVAKGYRDFEKQCVMEVIRDSGGEPGMVTAASAASLSNKLSQYADGAVYDDNRGVVEIHGEKLEALAEIEESVSSPLLVFYQFQHDRDRILSRFSRLKPEVYQGDDQLRRWNDGKIRMLLAHPASTAFGLNMQSGGHTVVWFSTGWNLELYQQANARLHRQGQRRPVTVFRLIAQGTVDERMAAAITGKGEMQRGFMDQMKSYIKGYGKS